MEILDRFENIIKKINREIIIFELGTNDGYHTNLMCDILHKHNKNFKYYAFEPDKRLKDIFLSKTKNYSKNIFFSEYAISDTDDNSDFYLSDDINKSKKYTGSSSIRKPKLVLTAWTDMTFEKTNIETISLDSFCKNNNIEYIDFIWADIQGAEVDMINGGQNIFKKTSHLYTEYCDGELYEGEIGFEEICKMLPEWQVIEDYKGDVLLKNLKYEN